MPAPIFDTQVAAGFLGERAQCSYHNLVHSFCGVSLPKTESLTDWSRRPLSPQQIEYAVDDVRYLIDAYRVIESKLHSLGRTAWVRDEIRPLADPAHYRSDPRSAFKRVKRINACTRRQLAVARELAAWREHPPRTATSPRKWVMSDEVLVALCRRVPKTIEDFRAVRGTEQLSARDVEVALDAIARGVRCPAENLPSIGRAHRTPAPELEASSTSCTRSSASCRTARASRLRSSSPRRAARLHRSPRAEPLARGMALPSWWVRSSTTCCGGDIGLTVKDGALEIL